MVYGKKRNFILKTTKTIIEMKKILITGGTGLLGKELVKGFLDKKCTVYFTSTSKQNSDKFLKSIKLKYKKYCVPIIQNFNNYDDINQFITKYKKVKFDTLINNARDISNLNLKVTNYEHYNSFNNEIFLAVYLPYFLSINLNPKPFFPRITPSQIWVLLPISEFSITTFDPIMTPFPIIQFFLIETLFPMNTFFPIFTSFSK